LAQALQKQVEKEALKGQRLEQQVETERLNAVRWSEKYSNLVKYFNTSSNSNNANNHLSHGHLPSGSCMMTNPLGPASIMTPPSIMAAAALAAASAASSSGMILPPPTTTVSGHLSNSKVNTLDSLGLRSIWNNPKTPSVVASPPTSEVRPGFSSSAGSSLLSKPASTGLSGASSSGNLSSHMNLFSTYPFDYGGVFSPMSASVGSVANGAASVTNSSSNLTSLAAASATSTSAASALYGGLSHNKCL